MNFGEDIKHENPAMNARRIKKLAYMSEWRSRNPNAKRDWYSKNKDRVAAYTASYRSTNKERLKKSMRLWRIRNLASRKAYKKKWASENKDKIKLQKKRAELRMISRHPHFMLRKRLKALIGHAVGGKGGEKTESYICCDIGFFSKWIESNFKAGMSWENRHLWSIDHIFPNACCGQNLDAIRKAQFYRNLVPAWNRDNHSKASNLTLESIVAAYICGIDEIHLQKPNQASDDILSKAIKLGFKITKNFK